MTRRAAPDADLSTEAATALAARGRGGRVFSAALAASVAALALVVYLYASETSRTWSLPVVPPFGGGRGR